MVDLGGINLFPFFSQAMYWGGIILGSTLILVFFYFIIHYISFDHNMTYWELYGSGKDGIFSIGKQKNNQVKWVKNKTAWRTLFPLFNKNDIEPFDSEYLYPGKKIYAFKINNIHIPGRININKTEEEIRGEINPVPYHYRNWQSLQHKLNEQEFAKQSFWEDNKYFFMVVITAAICLGVVGLTVYLTYKFASDPGGGLAVIKSHTEALRNFGTLPGR